MERLAKAIKYMPNLTVIDISSNNPSGKSLQYMVESLTEAKSVRTLDVSNMFASVQVMGTFAEKLVEFGSQLQKLRVNGNYMDDAVTSRLESNLPVARQLQDLEISVDDLSRKHHNQLVMTTSQLSRPRDLAIYGSQYPDDLLMSASDVMGSLPDLYWLALCVHILWQAQCLI